MKRRLPIIVMFMLLISIACTATIPAGYYRTGAGENKYGVKTAGTKSWQRSRMVNNCNGANVTWEAIVQLYQLTDGYVWDNNSNN